MDQLKTSPCSHTGEFIDAIKAGGEAGEKAMMALYARYCKSVKAYLLTLVSKNRLPHFDPDDIVHDAFIVMLQKIRYESIAVTSMKSFWIGIAKNLALNHIKKISRVSMVEDPIAEYKLHQVSPEKIFLDDERFREIEKCIFSCGGRCGEILMMWLADYSMQEIAEKLQLSGPTVARKLKHACFKKLKSMIISHNIFGT